MLRSTPKQYGMIPINAWIEAETKTLVFVWRELAGELPSYVVLLVMGVV